MVELLSDGYARAWTMPAKHRYADARKDNIAYENCVDKKCFEVKYEAPERLDMGLAEVGRSPDIVRSLNWHIYSSASSELDVVRNTLRFTFQLTKP
jgi:hypothetical protein